MRAPFHQITEREITPVSPGERGGGKRAVPHPRLAVLSSAHSPPEWQTHVEPGATHISQTQGSWARPTPLALAKGTVCSAGVCRPAALKRQ